MIAQKEFTSAQSLLIRLQAVTDKRKMDVDLLDVLTQEFSALILQLSKRESNLFGNLRNYDLQEIRRYRKLTKQSAGPEFELNFNKYRELLLTALERTSDYIADYL